MVNNTYDATVECLEKLHRVGCPECPKVSEKFQQKWCPTCTRRVGYAVLERLSKEPWFDTKEILIGS
jgi:hypothetical protein